MSTLAAWTDERIATLTRLWREGVSASTIARQLGGTTRNAVIGKVHRLGLSGHPTPPRCRRPRARTPRPEPRLPRPRPLRALEVAAAEPPMVGTADIVTVGRRACRWPIGEPKAADFALCGRPAVRGAYCAAHGAIAYRPTARDHLLKLASFA